MAFFQAMKLFLAGALIAAVGCSGNGGGTSTAAIPLEHRPSEVMCSGSRPATDPQCVPSGTLGAQSKCSADSDCTAGDEGRCIAQHYYPLGDVSCQCSYRQCTADSDCSTGGPCRCAAASSGAYGSACLPGNCRIDADCGAGGYCSPTRSRTEVFQNKDEVTVWAGYYCHTAADTCTNDSDCVTAETSWGAHCAYEPDAHRWSCARYWTE